MIHTQKVFPSCCSQCRIEQDAVSGAILIKAGRWSRFLCLTTFPKAEVASLLALRQRCRPPKTPPGRPVRHELEVAEEGRKRIRSVGAVELPRAALAEVEAAVEGLSVSLDEGPASVTGIATLPG